MYKVYLDTCIISGLAKEDLPQKEQDALFQLLDLHDRGELSLVTSYITLTELEKIPAEFRRRHEIFFRLIKKIPVSRAIWVNDKWTLVVGGGKRVDPLFTRLKTILPDENDVYHVFQALKSNCFYFVTTDRRTILKHNIKLFMQFDEFMVMSPSEIMSLLSVPE